MLSKQELISKADAACSAASARARSAGSTPSGFRTEPVVAANYLDLLEPVIHKLHADQVALVAPDSVKPAWTDYLTILGQATQLFNSADAKAHAKDPTAVADFDRANRLGPILRAAASTVGATTCAGH